MFRTHVSTLVAKKNPAFILLQHLTRASIFLKKKVQPGTIRKKYLGTQNSEFRVRTRDPGNFPGFFTLISNCEKSWFLRQFPGCNPEPGISVETLPLTNVCTTSCWTVQYSSGATRAPWPNSRGDSMEASKYLRKGKFILFHHKNIKCVTFQLFYKTCITPNLVISNRALTPSLAF